MGQSFQDIFSSWELVSAEGKKSTSLDKNIAHLQNKGMFESKNIVEKCRNQWAKITSKLTLLKNNSQ